MMNRHLRVIARSEDLRQSFKRLLRACPQASVGVVRKDTAGQSTIEFTFAVIVVMFLIYGMVQVFRWAGMDLAGRRVAQDASLTNLVGTDPSSELESNAPDLAQPMAAVYHGSITTNGSTSP